MRALWFALAALILMLPVACDNGDDQPRRDVPRTVPPVPSLFEPNREPVTPVHGTGPVYEAARDYRLV